MKGLNSDLIWTTNVVINSLLVRNDFSPVLHLQTQVELFLFFRSKSFIRIPVFYSPLEAGQKSEGHLEVSTVTGQARSSFVKLTGVCASKR